jgi:hypothetical protein
MLKDTTTYSVTGLQMVIVQLRISWSKIRWLIVVLKSHCSKDALRMQTHTILPGVTFQMLKTSTAGLHILFIQISHPAWESRPICNIPALHHVQEKNQPLLWSCSVEFITRSFSTVRGYRVRGLARLHPSDKNVNQKIEILMRPPKVIVPNLGSYLLIWTSDLWGISYQDPHPNWNGNWDLVQTTRVISWMQNMLCNCWEPEEIDLWWVALEQNIVTGTMREIYVSDGVAGYRVGIGSF